MSEKWIIRTENNADYDSIDRVIVSASGEPESELVRNLRSDGDVLLSLVAETESHIVGHIMMSRMLIEDATGDIAAVALAPLMVDPAYQNQRIGSLLTRVALERCRELGESIFLVLGHPSYYPRFGFSADLAQPLKIPFDLKVPGAFMALDLKPGALRGISGKVKYPRAFRLPAEWTMQDCPPIAIRKFEDPDEAAVVDVWLRSGKATYVFLPIWQTITSASAVLAFRHDIKAKCDIWVAVMNGEIVGYLALNGPYIDRLYVDPKVQRTGCGTLLLNFAKKTWPGGLHLHTHQQNVSARAFYEKNGFRAVRFGTSPAPECAPDVEYRWNGAN